MAEAFLGEIRMFGGNFAPRGWEFCNGQLVSIANYDALFVLIGTIYGGDGVTTFALPDLRSRIPVHRGTFVPTNTPYTLGQKAGTESQTLTTGSMPAHTHTMSAATTAATSSAPGTSLVPAATTAPMLYGDSNSNQVSLNPSTVQPAGGSQPFGTMMPFQCINFIICMEGIFPQQN